MSKDVDGWNQRKKRLDAKQKPPFYNEGPIWWCSIGVNVGFELYGKSEIFTRPVLVLRKYSQETFFGLPLTSKQKDRPAYYGLDFHDSQGSIILDQGRTLDSRRLIRRMGELPESVLYQIKEAFRKYI